MKIAFFDSGIGGLSVLHLARRMMPRAQFMFYADKDHVPYGTKTPEEVCRYVAEAFNFLTTRGATAIVVACNTATSVAVLQMRRRYNLPIIGMEPAAKKALDDDPTRRVLVTATPITVRGQKMQNLIAKVDRHHLVDLLPLPRLVEFAEKGEFSSKNVREYLCDALAPYNFADYSALVLGCTHFNYFKDTLREILPPHVRLTDGIEGTVRELRRHLATDILTGNSGEISYFYSGRLVVAPAELAKINKYLSRLADMEKIC